jgi:hypothetical protein
MQHVIKSAIIPQISKLNDLINSTPDTGSMKFGYVFKKTYFGTPCKVYVNKYTNEMDKFVLTIFDERLGYAVIATKKFDLLQDLVSAVHTETDLEEVFDEYNIKNVQWIDWEKQCKIPMATLNYFGNDFQFDITDKTRCNLGVIISIKKLISGEYIEIYSKSYKHVRECNANADLVMRKLYNESKINKLQQNITCIADIEKLFKLLDQRECNKNVFKFSYNTIQLDDSFCITVTSDANGIITMNIQHQQYMLPIFGFKWMMPHTKKQFVSKNKVITEILNFEKTHMLNDSCDEKDKLCKEIFE